MQMNKLIRVAIWLYCCFFTKYFFGLKNLFSSHVLLAATGDIPAYQLRSPNSGLAQSIVMAASPSSMQSPSSQHAEEITRKREVRLMKNRWEQQGPNLTLTRELEGLTDIIDVHMFNR